MHAFTCILYRGYKPLIYNIHVFIMYWGNQGLGTGWSMLDHVCCIILLHKQSHDHNHCYRVAACTKVACSWLRQWWRRFKLLKRYLHYTKQVTMVLSHTTRGHKEMLNVMGDIQVNSHCVTIAFLHFVALPLSAIMDQLAPVEFSS